MGMRRRWKTCDAFSPRVNRFTARPMQSSIRAASGSSRVSRSSPARSLNWPVPDLGHPMNETAMEGDVRLPPDVVYDAHPDTYRHWTLSFDGPIATLALGTDEEGGIRSGYRLKLNS